MSDLPSEQPKSVQAAGSASGPAPAPAARVSNRLFTKYVGLFVAVVWSRCWPTAFSTSSLLSGAQGIAHPHPARTGGGRGRQDQPVHRGNREPARLDDAAAMVGRLDRAAPLRRLAAAAPGAGHHRAFAARCERQRAAAGLAARHGRDRQRHRLFERPEVHRGGGAQGLLRPGLFPPGVRALHDAGRCRHAARRRRERRRGQSQADLGRRLADQGRRERQPMSSARRGG